LACRINRYLHVINKAELFQLKKLSFIVSIFKKAISNYLKKK